ncbi:hypothetical protein UFOVP1176_42 [uncultured Caudovirales phage]|uniref:Uncharacterized protein n=1 Tax=uncultured Caudovirales phage TaxID=2100421 RepID=A0A6J5R500_9CAUD|nr:hypothetical protein UFOVP1176_42 [uncultured Caudovirales phage]
MTSILIHRVKSLELKEPSSLVGQVGVFWTRKIFVIDESGNKTEITLFADDEQSLEIKELT